jgi:hypothetical protein
MAYEYRLEDVKPRETQEYERKKEEQQQKQREWEAKNREKSDQPPAPQN